MTLLSVSALSIAFRRYEGVLGQRDIPVIDALDFDMARGEVLALVGASGAGKSLVAHALFDILPPNAVMSGRLSLGGAVLDAASWPAHRGRRMGLVPQSPACLDPLARCGHQLRWAAARGGLRIDGAGIGRALSRFGLEAAVARAFPHQLSGGMARRLMLAMATICEPDLVVADEPTSGLDTEQAGTVLAHLRQLADQGKAVLLITHDLAQALPHADRVAILRDGRMAGIEPAGAFRAGGDALRTPYARALWRALPDRDFAVTEAPHA